VKGYGIIRPSPDSCQLRRTMPGRGGNVNRRVAVAIAVARLPPNFAENGRLQVARLTRRLAWVMSVELKGDSRYLS
jgi:hypothetical protein